VSLREDFARWRDDPMTRMVMDALGKAEAEQKHQWDKASWEGAVSRAPELERMLLELRTRADAYRALQDMSLGDLQAWLGIEEEAVNAE
jgi:hypothetical protein